MTDPYCCSVQAKALKKRWKIWLSVYLIPKYSINVRRPELLRCRPTSYERHVERTPISWAVGVFSFTNEGSGKRRRIDVSSRQLYRRAIKRCLGLVEGTHAPTPPSFWIFLPFSIPLALSLFILLFFSLSNMLLLRKFIDIRKDAKLDICFENIFTLACMYFTDVFSATNRFWQYVIVKTQLCQLDMHERQSRFLTAVVLLPMSLFYQYLVCLIIGRLLLQAIPLMSHINMMELGFCSITTLLLQKVAV